jgi:hypothetical protein
MILIVAALVCVATVPLTGGQLRRVVELRFRWSWASSAPAISSSSPAC